MHNAGAYLRELYKESWPWENCFRTWSLAFICTLLVPLLLIFQRGGADVVFSLTGVLFLWRSYKVQQWGWLRDPLFSLALIAWIWLMGPVSLHAVSVINSWSVAVPWIRYPLFYAALRHWVLLGERARAVAGYMLTALLLFVVIDTLWQYMFGVSLTRHVLRRRDRLTGPMDNVKVGIYLAKLLLPSTGLALTAAIAAGRKRLAAAMFGFFLLSEITILLSGERTAFFSSMLAVVVIITFLSLSERRMRIAALGTLIVLMVAALILISTQVELAGRAQWLIENLSDFPHSSYGQLAKAALLLGSDHWFMGVGLKGFRVLCEPLLANNIVTYCDLHPHNTYLEWFVESGGVGLMLYIAMVATLGVLALKHFATHSGFMRFISVAALGTIIVHFFPLIVTQSMFSNWPAILLWYSVSLIFAALRPARVSV